VLPEGDDLLLGAVAAIAERLEARAVPVREGGLAWVRRQGDSRRPLGIDLYSGTAGIALFFAAWARSGGGDRARDVCFEALAPLRRQAARLCSHGTPDGVLVGAGFGLSGTAYALALLADLLFAPELLTEARDLFAALPPDAFSTDEYLDVVTGSAGAVLAGLALDSIAARHGVDPGPALCQARRATERLRKRVTNLGDGVLGWPPAPGARPVSGFAHGAAGIVFALTALAARTGIDVTDMVRGGLAMERSSFSPEAGNWRDLRVDQERFMTMWCHGAAGIGLARLGMLGLIEDPLLHDEIDSALRAIKAVQLDGLDHVCCGNLGRAEVLVVAALRLDRPAELIAARDLARAVVERSRLRGCGRRRTSSFVATASPQCRPSAICSRSTGRHGDAAGPPSTGATMPAA
jgi:lantibiotic modifying enzyme